MVWKSSQWYLTADKYKWQIWLEGLDRPRHQTWHTNKEMTELVGGPWSPMSPITVTWHKNKEKEAWGDCSESWTDPPFIPFILAGLFSASVLKYKKQNILEEFLEFRFLVLFRSYMRSQRDGAARPARPRLWSVHVARKTNGVVDARQ